MSDDLTSALRDAERRMQAAQLAGDADVLDGLLDDRLIYTGGPDGARYSKQDDLEIERSRTQRLSKVEELIVFDVDMTAVASDDSLDQHARTEQMKAARGPSVHTHRSSSTRWRRSGARWPPRLFRAPGGECAGRPAGGQLQREPQWVFIRKCGLDVLGAMVAMGFVAALI